MNAFAGERLRLCGAVSTGWALGALSELCPVVDGWDGGGGHERTNSFCLSSCTVYEPSAASLKVA